MSKNPRMNLAEIIFWMVRDARRREHEEKMGKKMSELIENHKAELRKREPKEITEARMASYAKLLG